MRRMRVLVFDRGEELLLGMSSEIGGVINNSNCYYYGEYRHSYIGSHIISIVGSRVEDIMPMCGRNKQS